jgi:hypothetical protein
MTQTITTNSELIIYRSYAGHLSCVPSKPICQNMVKVIPFNSEISYMGIKTLGKNRYDLFDYQGLEFIAPIDAIAH